MPTVRNVRRGRADITIHDLQTRGTAPLVEDVRRDKVATSTAESAESMDTAVEASEITAGAPPCALLPSLMLARRPEMPSLGACGL